MVSSEHDGGANSVTIEYSSTANQMPPGERRVVLNGNVEKTYSYLNPTSIWAGIRRLQALATGGTEIDTRSYDNDQRLLTKVDPEGFETHFDYDTANRLIERIEAFGEPEQRRIVQQWSSVGNRMTSRTLFDASGQQFQQRTYAYDAAGHLMAECLHDFDDPTAASYACGSAPNAPAGVRQTRYLRCEAADLGLAPHYCAVEGALKRVDGPRVDVSNQTDYVYYVADAAGCASGGSCGHLQGDLAQAVNVLGHITQYAEFDADGRPVRILDPNGIERTLAYHPRGWVSSESVNGLQTQYAYFPDGTLQTVTRPDGSTLTFSYDQARRMTSVEDALGGRMEFTLNAAGQREQEVIKDASGTIQFQVNRHFDDFQRLERLVDGLSYETTFAYDKLGNQTDVVDPLLNPTVATHDAHSRVQVTTDALSAATSITYNIRNQITSVTDAEGLVTTYAYNNLGDLVALTSPDTGVTSFTYDEAGNPTQRTDARGITAINEYDALNRLTFIDYPDDSQNITFSHDDPASALTACTTSFSVGRLTQLIDSSGTTQWCYDALGNTTMRYQAHRGHSLRCRCDVYGRLSGIDYPSGKAVTYQRNANGEISEVLVGSINGQRPLSFVSDIQRAPFGPIVQIDFASGRSSVYGLDLNYQIVDVVSDGLDLNFDRDAVGNILGLVSPSTQAVIEQYGYDDAYRLTSVADAAGTSIESFNYDLIGNRLSSTTSSGTSNYSYQAGTHRLVSVGADARTFDTMGNTITRDNSAETFVYDDRGRLVTVQIPGLNGGTTASYVINGLGQRVRKTVQGFRSTQAIYFIYDESGRLMGEYKPAKFGLGLDPWREYIWVDNRLVGVFDEAGAVNEVYTDHLGTPRAVLNDSGQKRWEWAFDQNAFGTRVPDEDPSGLRQRFELNLRFPGQYYDAETGLHYNYFRDYEPEIGRYVQSDPIGLFGGVSTFAYVSSSPFGFIDPLGLNRRVCNRVWVETTEFDLFRNQIISTGGEWRTTSCGFLPGQATIDCEADCLDAWNRCLLLYDLPLGETAVTLATGGVAGLAAKAGRGIGTMLGLGPLLIDFEGFRDKADSFCNIGYSNCKLTCSCK